MLSYLKITRIVVSTTHRFGMLCRDMSRVRTATLFTAITLASILGISAPLFAQSLPPARECGTTENLLPTRQSIHGLENAAHKEQIMFGLLE